MRQNWCRDLNLVNLERFWDPLFNIIYRIVLTFIITEYQPFNLLGIPFLCTAFEEISHFHFFLVLNTSVHTSVTFEYFILGEVVDSCLMPSDNHLLQIHSLYLLQTQKLIFVLSVSNFGTQHADNLQHHTLSYTKVQIKVCLQSIGIFNLSSYSVKSESPLKNWEIHSKCVSVEEWEGRLFLALFLTLTLPSINCCHQRRTRKTLWHSPHTYHIAVCVFSLPSHPAQWRERILKFEYTFICTSMVNWREFLRSTLIFFLRTLSFSFFTLSLPLHAVFPS